MAGMIFALGFLLVLCVVAFVEWYIVRNKPPPSYLDDYERWICSPFTPRACSICPKFAECRWRETDHEQHYILYGNRRDI